MGMKVKHENFGHCRQTEGGNYPKTPDGCHESHAAALLLARSFE